MSRITLQAPGVMPGLGTNPYALGHDAGRRANYQGQLYQLMADRIRQQPAAEAANQAQFGRDFALAALEQSGDLGQIYGPHGLARLMGPQGAALLPEVENPGSFANMTAQLLLDQQRGDVMRDIGAASQDLESTGQMPNMAPDMLLRLGVRGLRDVIPQATQRRSMGGSGSASQSPSGDLRINRFDEFGNEIGISVDDIPAGDMTSFMEQFIPRAPGAPAIPGESSGQAPSSEAAATMDRVVEHMAAQDFLPTGQVGPRTLPDGRYSQQFSNGTGEARTVYVNPDGSVTVGN